MREKVSVSVPVFESGKRREGSGAKLSDPITQYMQCVPPSGLRMFSRY